MRHLAILLALLPAACGGDDRPRLRLATTTSVRDSGLLDVLLPAFEKEAGVRVEAVAVGTGQAITLARNGDCDALLVHDPAAEEKFVADGAGTRRMPFMYNTFEIVGPEEDPAGIRDAPSAADAMRRIAGKGAAFVSRGDDSGTHRRERALWAAASVDPAGKPWYAETGQGMGATLIVASERQGYTLTDRGTYLALRDRAELVTLCAGDPALKNIYSFVDVSPKRHPHVNAKGAAALSDFLSTDAAREIIAGLKQHGEPLFQSLGVE